MYHQNIQENDEAGMLKQNNEIKMIWLMMLIMVGIGAWYLDVRILSYISGIGFMLSVMNYVDDLQHGADALSSSKQPFQVTSKVSLYIASLLTVVGLLTELGYLVAIGISLWVYFFLRWLKRLERQLHLLQGRALQSQSSHAATSISAPTIDRPEIFDSDNTPSVHPATAIGTARHQAVVNSSSTNTPSKSAPNLSSQIQQWLFQGNPVLKVAVLVLVIGVVLLLRFATEHWQLSLAMKLLIVSLISAGVVGLGYWLQAKNRSFALALEGLGLAALFLTLFFAYYNAVIAGFGMACVLYAVLMALTIWLSLKQQSVELAIMAMLIAYLAPFTLPVRDATATEFIAYYLVINIAVAVMSTLRPWKYLNQIAFLMTVIMGGDMLFTTDTPPNGR